MMTKNESAQNNIDADLESLAELIQARNAGIKNEVDEKDLDDLLSPISTQIGKKAQIGNIAEYIASRIFHIALPEKGIPGRKGFFMSGPLAGQSVIVKMYGEEENIIDILPKYVPAYYLVIKSPTFPESADTGSLRIKKWLVKEVFLFEAHPLIERLQDKGKNIGVATSLRQYERDQARIYPILPDYSPPYRITNAQQQALRIFEPE